MTDSGKDVTIELKTRVLHVRTPMDGFAIGFGYHLGGALAWGLVLVAALLSIDWITAEDSPAPTLYEVQ